MGADEYAGERPPFQPEEEVRLAVVMYGGVSLAIYINGVVQELFRLVRATAPVHPFPDEPEGQVVYFPTYPQGPGDRALAGSERVYRRIGQLLPAPANAGDVLADDAPVRTRFVIDILSGSSAGGINGIFLAKALANQQDIEQLRNLWIAEAGIADLLNDKRSYEQLPETLKVQDPPPSLLNGYRLYVKAYEALEAMTGREENPEDDTSPSYAEQVDLAVTATDLQGLLLPIKLYDRVVYEPRHRQVFRFRYATEAATGEHRNDFVAENNRFLAFAARCTSSFPFAFEPMVLSDLAALSPDGPPTRTWNRFFEDYVVRGADFANYAFADGGYLDNKPFTAATAHLRHRRADVPVDRKLVYIEPDPSGDPISPEAPPQPAAPAQPRLDAIANVYAAAVALPRHEPIRDDIEALLARNRTIERLRELTLQIEDAVLVTGADPLAGLSGLAMTEPDDVVDASLGSLAPLHRAYRQLREQLVTDELAALVTRLTGLLEESDDAYAVRLLVRAWEQSAHQSRLRAFLYEFDLSFRLRRLSFLQERINDFLRGGKRAEKMLGLAEAQFESLALSKPGLRRLKLQLSDVAVELRRRVRALRRGVSGDPARPDEQLEIEEIQLAIGELGIGADELVWILQGNAGSAGQSPDDALARASDVVATADREDRLFEVAELVSSYLYPTFEDADGKVEALLTAPGAIAVDPELLALLLEYYERFESFDMVMLPLAYPGLEEANAVEVLRISPEDAPSLVPEGPPAWQRKLAGTSFHHFGGFLDETWRRNDLLWGRLDGAERIIAALVPAGGLRKQLISGAHSAIIREELIEHDAGSLTDLLAGALARPDAGLGLEDVAELAAATGETERATLRAALAQVPDEVLLKHFRESYELPPAPEARATVAIAGRALSITGRVLEGYSRVHRWPARPVFWIARLGQLIWGIAEVAMPGGRAHLAGIFYRHWTQLGVLLALILILFGLSGVEGAQKVGWILLAGVLAFRAVVWLAEALMEPPPAPVGGDGGAVAPGAQDAAPSRGSRILARTLREGLLAAAVTGFGLVVVGMTNDWVQTAGWILVAVAAVAYAIRPYILRQPGRRMLSAALPLIVLILVALAALEVSRHTREDVSAVFSYVWGNETEGLEGTLRDGWNALERDVLKRLWPWDD